jgi:RNA polymerase sigma-70 factor, ECF subfamily
VGRITAALIDQTGDWDLAEECAQDAFTQVLRRWGGVAAGAGRTERSRALASARR